MNGVCCKRSCKAIKVMSVWPTMLKVTGANTAIYKAPHPQLCWLGNPCIWSTEGSSPTIMCLRQLGGGGNGYKGDGTYCKGDGEKG